MSENSRADADGSPDTPRGPAAGHRAPGSAGSTAPSGSAAPAGSTSPADSAASAAPAQSTPSTGRTGSAESAEDELARRITQALRARAAVHPDPAVVAARIEARLSDVPAPSSVSTLRRRGGRVVVAGLVTSTLAVAGAGAAAAANPYSGVARAVENVAQAVGIEWSAMPDGYTREQYEAFWGAGYTVEDMDALSALWDLGYIETKARAGQLLLDGQALPLDDPTPRTPVDLDVESPATPPDAFDAFGNAGYTYEDAVALSELWNLDVYESKARAGELLLAGQEPPIEPGSAPTPAAEPEGDAPGGAPVEDPVPRRGDPGDG